ncbi:site-specific DNA recombinase [Anaerosolibacter carboniphilus]|uniref:Site-specific DNA recombinase n=1 Tax=Anaerosolibacter carboniphilus TaxID=1417629 RepID=A0A841L1X2_9FIRM|nr:recombinase family protein [Anaerosolibacter carboniphilus]MBB6217162.1 site-specific DNA recombinase [Anaerosolibacter carboniphilus]
MKVAIYSRKSKFTGKGESTQNQIELCKEYAIKHFSIDDFVVYEDEGFSGGNTDRPEYQRMLSDAKKKKFDTLICYRLDRISRNVLDFSNTIEMLQAYNISFVSIREQFDTSTPMGRAMMYISSVFAQLERETIAERIRDNMHQLARSGRWLGGITPTGFESVSYTYQDENLSKRKAYRLSPIPEELDLIRSIYYKYLELESLTKLESWSLESHVKTRNGNNFEKSTLKMILTNPVYAVADQLLYEYFESYGADMAGPKQEFDGYHGLMVFNKHDEKKKNKVMRKDKSEWIVAVGDHMGIIPSKDWIHVQNLIDANADKAPRAGTGNYGILTRLLRCTECGSKMRVSLKHNKSKGITHYYYKCLMKEQSRGSHCNIQNLNGIDTDQIVLGELKRLAFDESDLAKELGLKKKTIHTLKKVYELDRKHLEKELAKLETSIQNLTLQLAENQNSSASKYIIQQIESIDVHIVEIRKKLQDIDDENESSLIKQMNIEIIQELMKNFTENYDNLSFEEKRKMLNQIIDEITWDGNRIEINVFGYNRTSL